VDGRLSLSTNLGDCVRVDEMRSRTDDHAHVRWLCVLQLLQHSLELLKVADLGRSIGICHQ